MHIPDNERQPVNTRYARILDQYLNRTGGMDTESVAAGIGSDPELLRARFNRFFDHTPIAWVRTYFRLPGRLCMPLRRFYGHGAYLEWRMRPFPDQPIGPDNQQTSLGIVQVEYAPFSPNKRGYAYPPDWFPAEWE